MQLVILETPYASETEEGCLLNIEFARLCMRDCFLRGEAPFASHLLYTQPGILDDKEPSERMLGINSGLLWGKAASKTVVYLDKGVSKGMVYGIQNAKENNRDIEYRFLNNLLEESLKESLNVKSNSQSKIRN
jgi:hypothetical protein